MTYQEQGEGVQRQAHGVEAEAVQPALWIPQRLGDIVPCEPLVVGRVAVRRKTSADEASLLVRQEVGRLGVVVDEPVCPDGYQDSSYPFLWSGQSARL